MLVHFALAAALGFSAPAPQRATASARSSPVMVEMSKSIPFMKKPAYLDGSMPGDQGFDPLGISTSYVEIGGDLSYMQEGEIINGRVAMLAAAGYMVEDLARLPGDVYGSITGPPFAAQFQVPAAAYVQILLAIAFSEGLRSQQLYQPGHKAGDYGFDPLGFKSKFCKSDADFETMKLKEINNGRLAMLGVAGMFAGECVTGKGPFGVLFGA